MTYANMICIALPFRTTMIIKALYRGSRFLEANIVKSCKGGTIDIFNRMVRNQKVFFPPHKYKICPLQCLVIKRVGIECFGILTERLELTL